MIFQLLVLILLTVIVLQHDVKISDELYDKLSSMKLFFATIYSWLTSRSANVNESE